MNNGSGYYYSSHGGYGGHSGGAGIELPEGSTLHLMGSGSVIATGGKGGKGGNGASTVAYSGYSSGGAGGGGGGGAGAGIGTAGGPGGTGGGAYKFSDTSGDFSGSATVGKASAKSGTLVVTGSVSVTATGGADGTRGYGGSSAAVGSGQASGGAGGGGGAGSKASDIGSGGAGGGGGGAGCGSYQGSDSSYAGGGGGVAEASLQTAAARAASVAGMPRIMLSRKQVQLRTQAAARAARGTVLALLLLVKTAMVKMAQRAALWAQEARAIGRTA